MCFMMALLQCDAGYHSSACYGIGGKRMERKTGKRGQLMGGLFTMLLFLVFI